MPLRGAGTKILTKRCEGLRWKGMFIEAAGEEDPNVPHPNTRLYWCVYTQNCMGPDHETVDENTCTASRSCFKLL
jgi:hypothetical protein